METKLTKNQKADTGKYSYQYVDIAQIHDYLESIGTRYYQYIERIDNDDYIMTVPIVENKELTPRRGCRVVDATLIGVNNPAQQQGSALTYARRYSLLMAFGLATEDDDAQSLSKKKEPTLEDAKKYKFPFGKYSGQTIEEIFDEDEQYVDWWLDNKADDYFKKCYELITGTLLPTEEEKKEQLDLLVEFNNLINKTNTNKEELYKHYGVENNTQMSVEQFKEAIAIMKKKLK